MAHSRLPLLLAALMAACGGGRPPTPTGTATASLSLVPAEARCVVIAVAGASSTAIRQLDVAPESSSVYALTGLPVGSDTFSARAYTVGCAQTSGAVAGWASDPVVATVVPSPPVGVTLVMKAVAATGGATVGVEFPPASAGAGVITLFTLGPDRYPTGIATGPDGNLWFTERDAIGPWVSAGWIASISADGSAINEYAVPPTTGLPNAMAVGADGNLWFTASGPANTVQLGTVVLGTSVSLVEKPELSGGVRPNQIATGPDGRVWFTDDSGIGAFSPVNLSQQVFPVPVLSPAAPNAIAVGSDGAIWFTDWLGRSIRRVTAGGEFAKYPIPVATSSADLLSSLALGSDGALWFAMPSWGSIGRITTAGTVSDYPLGAGHAPNAICAGPDGNLWFTDTGSTSIGRLDPGTGTVAQFPVPGALDSLRYGGAMAAGPDGNVWFVLAAARQVGRITTQ